MKLWEKERHHDAVFHYSKLKVSFYNTVWKLKDEHTSKKEKRTCLKLLPELEQNITDYQTNNKYYLELFTAKRNTSC